MRADDDGFVNNPKRIQRMIGASEDDLKLLLAKRFILGFENGVVVIKHWRMHNLLRKDRYNPTQYIEQKSQLEIKEDGAYTEKPLGNHLATTWQPNGNQMATQVSIGKDSIVEDSIGESISAEPTPAPKPKKRKFGEYSHVLLTEEQNAKLIEEYGEDMTVKAITFLDEYIEMKGYKAKNHYLAIKKWVIDAVKEREQKNQGSVGGSFETDDFFGAAISKTFAKTAGEDEEIRKRAEALKQKLS
jgi:hypothetical protein